MPLYKYMISSCLICTIQPCFAAALEQSGQSLQFFFENDNYAEIFHAVLVPDVKAEIKRHADLDNANIQDFSTGDLAQQDQFSGAAIKLQIHPKISLGMIYDQPFATHASYQYQAQINDGELYTEAANIQFNSQNLTGLIGYQPSQNWTLYSGLSYQQFQGRVFLKGKNYSIFDGYHTEFNSDHAWGWLAGISYQLPQYAFRTALTYRSKITHKNQTDESLDTGISLNPITTISTPKSINLDIQTGLSKTNLLYASLRWVNWKAFEVQPPQIQSFVNLYLSDLPEFEKIKMIRYEQDQWSGKLGIAHQWNPRWVNALELLWDSGLDNSATTLNPTDGHLGYGLANLYKLNNKIDISTAVYYLDFNKPRIEQNEEIMSQVLAITNVKDNSAWLFALKFGYHF
ncbi:transport of long-chain fatty acid [Acinetobacter wanghuae]|uniref:Transport of long-chain fatty acid n=1 Tax=Acinetobacter wanghuae TaxID=2662362 RepID=A0A5Q0P2S4_9GAMM|nr:outer membrane protein transport protein [Acinetobacter wanghuae]MQW91803.1 transport of long-chain fatty acid [Acinetobacter wanghuae]QGA11487.1 transport of long-chain fatty acid [Acinetobacter wanghuae]